MKLIKVSAKMARLRFNGCNRDYIKKVCHGACCRSSTAGMLVTIHPSEKEKIKARGGVVKNSFLQPRPTEKHCPFQNKDFLCDLHRTPAKPFGCIASPFTLNKNGTLIIRNRYKLLKCYNKGKRLPAYKAFRSSLVLIFGEEEATRISNHFDKGGGNLYAWISHQNFDILMENDAIKHSLQD